MKPDQSYAFVRWACFALVGGTVLASGVAAEQRGASQPGQQAFRADVSRVQIDVIVRDDQGFVDDLRLEDFEVFEDGRQVAVTSLELVDLRSAEARERELLGNVTEDRPPDPEARLPDPAEADEPATGSGAILFLVDGPSLSATTKLRFADAWQRIVRVSASPRIPRAAYFIDYANRLVELAPLSHDQDLLESAADAVAELPITSEDRTANLIDVVSALPGLGESGPDRLAGRVVIQMVKALEWAERMRALAAYDVLAAFCDALSVIEGRKAVIWVSSGVKLMAGGPYAAVMAAYQDIHERRRGIASDGLEAIPGIREIASGLNDPDDMVLERQRRLHEAANSANVSIYAVDPTPLIEARPPGNDVRLGPGAFREALTNPFVVRGLDALGDSLRNAAAATGGRAFVHATDIGAALREIDADASRYYLLTYEPPRAEPDGAYHDVRVEVDRPGVRVRFRAGYRHVSAAEQLERAREVVRQLPGLAQQAPADTRGGTPVAARGGAPSAAADRGPAPLPDNAARLVASWVRWDATRTSIAWGAHLANVTGVNLTVTLRVRLVDREGTVLGEDSHVIQELRPGSARIERDVINVDGALDAVHAGHVLVDYTAVAPRR